jgi:hypothetical protein
VNKRGRARVPQAMGCRAIAPGMEPVPFSSRIAATMPKQIAAGGFEIDGLPSALRATAPAGWRESERCLRDGHEIRH